MTPEREAMIRQRWSVIRDQALKTFENPIIEHYECLENPSGVVADVSEADFFPSDENVRAWIRKNAPRLRFTVNNARPPWKVSCEGVEVQ
jgi:hypothetical protein